MIKERFLRKNRLWYIMMQDYVIQDYENTQTTLVVQLCLLELLQIHCIG